MTEHFDKLRAAPKRPLKVFPSASLRASLCHAYIIPLWDADRDAVKALYTRLANDGMDT